MGESSGLAEPVGVRTMTPMAGTNVPDSRSSAPPDPLFDVTTPEGLAAVGAVRDRLLEEPDTDLTGLRPQIARSWRRCVAMSVDPADDGFEVDASARIDEQTLACAEPFVRELEQLAFDADGGETLMSPGGALVGDITPSIQ